jgi:uncharacterized membrane protein YiaA
MTINIDTMLARVRQLLEFELSIAELVGGAVLLAVPYLLVGLGWTITHAQALHGLRGLELAVSLLGSIALWPALLLANVCLA